MKSVIVLIDYENVPALQIDPTTDIEYRLYIFIGQNQKSIPTDTLIKISTVSKQPTFIQICGNSKNNLDFHLCAELGILHVQEPVSTEFIILSKDTGYDALIAYFAATKGRQVTRQENLLFPVQTPLPVPHVLNQPLLTERLPVLQDRSEEMAQRYRERLLTMASAKRPRKAQTLKNDIRSFLKKEQLTAKEFNQVYQHLIHKKIVMVDTSSNKVSYQKQGQKPSKKTQTGNVTQKKEPTRSPPKMSHNATPLSKEAEDKRDVLALYSGMGL